ncbi:TetR family transcriptional regulator [Streptomyces sp. B21-102]|uniref:TetR/AcrR family transcriptional regulator n=1 Tax=Streptomyces sp. B21-102 TaxID=3039416 RepID=UPI002FF0A76F
MGLREMKKAKVKQAIQRETLRLFTERGYRETTVEQIAAAAEISTTTFYRYYPSKEEVILSGIHERGQGEGRGEGLGGGLGGGRERSLHFVSELPAGVSVVEGLRAVLRGIQRSGALEGDRGALLARLRMINDTPELRALNAQRTQEGLRELAGLLAGPSGADPDGYEMRVLAAAVGGAVTETLRYWVERDGEPDIGDLFDRTLELMAPSLER